MMHFSRRWCVVHVESPEQLAEWLTQRRWTLCTGFEVGGYLFLNDATGEDGAQEYAVVKRPASTAEPFLQVESISMSWCERELALGHVGKTVAGDYDGEGFARTVSPRLETPEQHGRCHLCA